MSKITQNVEIDLDDLAKEVGLGDSDRAFTLILDIDTYAEDYDFTVRVINALQGAIDAEDAAANGT